MMPFSLDFGSRRLHLVCFLLLAIGLLNQYSASSILNFEPFYRQLAFSGVAIVIYSGIGYFIDYRLIGRLAIPIWVVGVALLATVIGIGVAAGGSTRWINLGFTRFQPSELAKYTTLVLLCASVARHEGLISRIQQLIIPTLVLGIPAAMVLVQPDLGTAGSIGISGAIVLLFAGIRKKLLVGIMVVALASGALGWNYVLKPYQKERVLAMLNPEQKAKSTGYQVIQSKIAIASGGVTGRGFMAGRQTHSKYLPEQHTDFAFAVWAEEWGFLGGAAVLLLYIWLSLELTHVALVARESLGTYLAIATTAYIMVPVWINVLMILGWFPTVGMALPFFTYGGTHTFVLAIFLGTVQSVYHRRNLF